MADQAPKKDKSVAGLDADRELKLFQAELLLNVSKTMAAYETLDEMLCNFVTLIIEQVNGERGTIFLNDEETGELYSRIMEGKYHYEIRFQNNTGVAGHVYQSGNAVIVDDAYQDERFNPRVDEKTGFVTQSILCVPIKTAKDKVVGVAQVLNKKKGRFTHKDLGLVEAMVAHAALALQSAHIVERLHKAREQEMKFFKVVADVTSEIDLGAILQKVMAEATRMLNAERSTLFLNDKKSRELFSLVGEGIGITEIRFPNHLGIAGTVFTTGKTVNIPHAYADLRFNPSVDRQTGFFTRSILCVPLINKSGEIIGVTQVLNKRGGPFTDQDASRLKAFTAQVAMALENAKLFDDLQNMKNYNEGILESMPSGLVTLNEDRRIITCNASGLRILEVAPEDILDWPAGDFFSGPNQWVLDKLDQVESYHAPEMLMDAELNFNRKPISVNMTLLPFVGVDNKHLGSMIMIENISEEKRMKSTMSRYMGAGVADRVLAAGDELLGGQNSLATVLFSDIRDFTTLSEELGAQATVSLLNEYFTIMVDCIEKQGGILDKFIGDAIMAAFGMPFSHGDDEDRAVRAAIAMITDLMAWNAKRITKGKKTIDMGIGLNTDQVVSGNIGSPKRMDYTMIGDGVNIASRLEGACKQYGAHILISENTMKKLHGTYRIREIDRIIVKGKKTPVGIYEVLDYHTDASFPNLMDVVNQFKYALEAFRAQQWTKAARGFQEALKQNPGDPVSKLYIERCEYFKRNPPGVEWECIWVMDSK